MLYILTLEEAKASLEIADSRDDSVLTSHMEQLQGRFTGFLDRELLRAENVVEHLDGGSRQVLVSRFPIESVSSVVMDSLSLAPQMYVIHQSRGRLALCVEGLPDVVWSIGTQNIVVTYTGGYVPAGTTVLTGQFAMPDAIRGAFRMQLEYEWRNRRILGNNSVSAQGSTVTLAPSKLLPSVRDDLSPYRRI